MILIIAIMISICGVSAADYVIPDHAAPKIAHAPNPATVIARAPAGSRVTVPVEHVRITAEQLSLATNLAAVVADSRKNIPELAQLSDLEVAMLYLAQMLKTSDSLEKIAPTNSLEYLIGAGMRVDIHNKTKEIK